MRMPKILLLLMSVTVIVNGQIYKIDNIRSYQFGYDHIVKGSVYLPTWTDDGSRIGADFVGLHVSSVGVVSRNKDIGTLIVVESEASGAGPGFAVSHTHQANTWNLIWARNKTEEFYVLSSLDNYVQLFEVVLNDHDQKVRTTNMIKATPYTDLLNSMHIMNPVLLDIPPKHFGTTSDYDLCFSYGKDKQNDLGKLRLESVGNNLKYEGITNTSDKNETLISGTLDNEKKMRYLVTVHNGNGSSLEYSFDMKSWEPLLSENYVYYTHPEFSPKGHQFAFLRSEELIKIEGANTSNLTFSLWIYNLDDHSQTKLFYPVFVENQKSKQVSFVWIDDENLLFIDGTADLGQPLKTVNVGSGSVNAVEVNTSHHFDLAYHPGTGYLAFTAKGNEDSDELSYTKLYTGRLIKK